MVNVWDVNVEVTATGPGSQTLEWDGSQQWKAMGDRYDHRHHPERFVMHGRALSAGCDLEMVSFQRHRAVGKLKRESNPQKLRGSA